jgi:hypothetical protein
MSDRALLATGIAVLLICLLGPGAAFASVKCQCNNGTISHSMSADYDDDDVDEACNDACDQSGGGRVWSVDTDRYDDGGDVTIRRGTERPKPARRR